MIRYVLLIDNWFLSLNPPNRTKKRRKKNINWLVTMSKIHCSYLQFNNWGLLLPSKQMVCSKVLLRLCTHITAQNANNKRNFINTAIFFKLFIGTKSLKRKGPPNNNISPRSPLKIQSCNVLCNVFILTNHIAEIWPSVHCGALERKCMCIKSSVLVHWPSTQNLSALFHQRMVNCM